MTATRRHGLGRPNHSANVVIMRVSLFAFACLSIALSSSLSATTIVGVWTKKQVTIAADSKQTFIQDGQIIPSRSQTGCKIFEVRHLVVALAGLAQSEEISVVDAITNSKELFDQDTHVKLPLESVVVGAESAVARILTARHATSDRNGSVALIVAGVVNGVLQMYRIENWGMQMAGDYSMPMAARRIEYPRDRGHNGSDPNRGIETIGIDDSIKRYQDVLPEWSAGGDVSVARRLVAVEAADSRDSAFVGPPISTVIVTKKGIRWINKGACE